MADPKDLRVVIVGAGMGGLGTALAFAKKGFKNINVYENAPNLGFVGAGIQMPPNVARVLDRLGVWDEIVADSTDVQGTSIRQGSTDEELSHVAMPNMREKYGYPHCTGHRASLAGGMYAGCQREPAITFHFSHTLLRIDSYAPTALLTFQPPGADAAPVQVPADVVLAADGIKSVTRTQMLASLSLTMRESDTGQAAYRIMLPRAAMAHDPELLALLDSSTVVRWIGPRRHIIAYPVSNHTIYNLSTAQPDDAFAAATNATYTTLGSKSQMREVYADFCPLVQRMLDLVPGDDVVEWKLRAYEELPTWTRGAVALVGDACHPTLPHLSQGAAMAVEDGAVLAECLSRVPVGGGAEAVARALKVYELLRKPRTSQLVELAAHSGRVLHLGEGQAKEERDRLFRDNGRGGSVPDKWASPDVQQMIYSYDCVKDAEERFEELYAGLEGQAAGKL
ncbi:FAD/NAD(P)-binding domain-containing protein [Podospora conica]|nr:FAD/NAD(P)-binding domain-containing protein [Schizothecium conicum]